MLRPTVIVALTSAALFVTFASGGCSHRDPLNLPPPDGGTSTFTSTDGSVHEPDAAGPIEYCPAYKCHMPYVTCPSSIFPCDVNIMADPLNCGGCGISCLANGSDSTKFDCVSGKCVPSCLPGYADCNGILDDDCEVKFGTNENCDGCGDRCPDPTRPCIINPKSGKGQCGCDDGLKLCSDRCVDTKADDAACGGCGIVCPNTGDAGEPPANTHYGCAGGECGHLKCDTGFADCDGSLVANGCETSLLSEKHCGGCKVACDPGQVCRLDGDGVPTCICPAGKTLCGSSCVDLRTDTGNCGGCGVNCNALVIVQTNGRPNCLFGSCSFECRDGWADCNGDPLDGCETSIASDPRHCGACGNACDLVSGQPCLGGQCAVEPCSSSVEDPE